MRQLYVCSKLLRNSNGTLCRHLIGVLSENDGSYRFEYRLDDSSESDALMLPIFPDKNKVYNDAETRILLNDYLPSETNTAFMTALLKKMGMNAYDEWEWLLTFDSDDPDAETKLYEALPPDIIRHDIPPDNNTDDSHKTEEAEKTAKTNEIIDKTNGTDENSDFVEFDDFDDIDFADFLDDDLPDTNNNNIADNYDDFDDIDDFDFDLDETDDEGQSKMVTCPLPETKAGIIIVKKTIRKRKKNISPGDFIDAPPESPMNIIQQRLLENTEQRKKALEAKLKINPYDDH